MKKRVAVFISGRGSNMMSLVKAASNPDYPADIALVLSNVAEAAGLAFARDKGIATAIVNHKDFPKDKPAFEAAISRELEKHKIEFICLAGFMRLLSPEFTQKWQGRMINIHPSLLPKFKGLDTHKRALLANETVHGATVHYVSAEMDEGEIIMQTSIDISLHDTQETLAAKLLIKENVLYPKALKSVLGCVEE